MTTQYAIEGNNITKNLNPESGISASAGLGQVFAAV